jgi:Tfp pilus assembly protein PilO
VKKIAPAVIVVFIFCLIFAAGFFGLVYPSLQPIGRKLTKLATYNQQQLSVGASSSRAAEVVTQRELLEKEQSKISKLLPNQTNLYDLSIQIEALTKNTGVTLTAISLVPAADTSVPATKSSAATAGVLTAPSGTAKSTLGLTLAGSYTSLRSFLDGLTQLERYIEVQDVSFTSGTSGITMTVNAVAYSVAQVVAPIATPVPAKTGGTSD